MTGSDFLALGRRTVLAIRGEDAERFLNGQITQDVRDCGDRALPACVTDAKGKLQFFIHVFRGHDGALMIEATADCRDGLLARLDRYLISDDAAISDESDQWILTHFLSDTPPSGPLVRASRRLGVPGYDVWTVANNHQDPPGVPLSDDDAESLRIRHRFPAWGKELVPGILPPEAGLDREAISYHKGCYIGQEVLSRIKSAGKVNRRLFALSLPAGARAGEPLPGGEITSLSPEAGEDGRHLALGYIGKTAFGLDRIDLESGGYAEVLGPV